MEYIKIIILSFASLTVLFISTKIIGNKQMSELNMFDYINGITIGSIAAEMATNIENAEYPLIAMGVYTVTISLISFLTQKNLKIRRFFSGRAIILMHKGKIYDKNFKTAKIDMSEFLTQCRINGYFNIDDIETAIIEENGKISFLPKTSARPVNTKDLNLLLRQEQASTTIILDGVLLSENLKSSGLDENWLKKELERLKINDINKVFLATCNDNKLSAYLRIESAPANDLFE